MGLGSTWSRLSHLLQRLAPPFFFWRLRAGVCGEVRDALGGFYSTHDFLVVRGHPPEMRNRQSSVLCGTVGDLECLGCGRQGGLCSISEAV